MSSLIRSRSSDGDYRRYRRILSITLSAALALGITLLLVGQLSSAVTAAPAQTIRYVAAGGGSDDSACDNQTDPCRSIQYAVDRADPGDLIKVAAGTYTDVVTRPASIWYPEVYPKDTITQVVIITKSLQMRGGYSMSDWTTSDPRVYPTTLDGEDEKRVVFVIGEITVTLENLHIRGGAADGDRITPYEFGGGLSIISATGTVSGTEIHHNEAPFGGGAFLGAARFILKNNRVFSNTADFMGGGLSLWASDHTELNQNRIYSNTAGSLGGGLLVMASAHTELDQNRIYHNRGAFGGGAAVYQVDDSTFTRNLVFGNGAQLAGGILVDQESGGTALSLNRVYSNSADIAGGIMAGFIEVSPLLVGEQFAPRSVRSETTSRATADSRVAITANEVCSNTSVLGGGLAVDNALVQDNRIFNNRATLGGGLLLAPSRGTPGATGNEIYGNTADWGGGIFAGYANVVFRRAADQVLGLSADRDGTTLAWPDDLVNPEDDNLPNAVALSGVDSVELEGEIAFRLDDNDVHSNTAVEDGGGVFLGLLTETVVISEATLGPTPENLQGRNAGWLSGPMRFRASRGSSVRFEESSTRQLQPPSGARLNGNAIHGNEANRGGGGVFVNLFTDTVMVANDIHENTAQRGGGIGVWGASRLVLEANQIYSNSARAGGGVQMFRSDDARLSQNAIGHNGADWMGGGVTILNSEHAVVDRNHVFGNELPSSHGVGGGILLYESQDAVVSGNQVFANAAGLLGGGVALSTRYAELSGNDIYENDAPWGGGLLAGQGSATSKLTDNRVSDNKADWGGGVLAGVWSITVDYARNSMAITLISTEAPTAATTASIHGSEATDGVSVTHRSPQSVGAGTHAQMPFAEKLVLDLSENEIRENTAQESGGGVLLGALAGGERARVARNHILSNKADRGAGLAVEGAFDAELDQNRVENNGSLSAPGVAVRNSNNVLLNGNQILGNRMVFDASNEVSALSPAIPRLGGGLSLWASEATIDNNIIADNLAPTDGSAVEVGNGSVAQLRHNTVARNRGRDGVGVMYVGQPSEVTMLNNVLVSHTVGIFVSRGCTATLSHTFWATGTAWANETAWVAEGTLSERFGVGGHPRFTAPSRGDYHIGWRSDAIDKGPNVGVETDVDGDPRPTGRRYDLGADEIALIGGATVPARLARIEAVSVGLAALVVVGLAACATALRRRTMTGARRLGARLFELGGKD